MECRMGDWMRSHSLFCGATPDMFNQIQEPDLKLLGRGAYGEVRLVKYDKHGKLYAMKVVNLRLGLRKQTGKDTCH
jgi:hypothetical protein